MPHEAAAQMPSKAPCGGEAALARVAVLITGEVDPDDVDNSIELLGRVREGGAAIRTPCIGE